MSSRAKGWILVVLAAIVVALGTIETYIYSKAPETTEMVPQTVTHAPPIFDALMVVLVSLAIATFVWLFVWMD